jgi:hypothetical protein
MVEIENQCVGCADGLGCRGRFCPNRNVRVVYCDHCGNEIDIDEWYNADGDDLCEDCLKKIFKKGG